MGHKVSPTGIRLGINKYWNSVWYAGKSDYARLLHEDLKIRGFVSKKLKNAGVHKVRIERSMNNVTIKVIVARPGVVIGRGGAGIETLKKELDNMVKSKVDLKIEEVKDPELSAKFIAESIADQVERRVVPKFAISREIEKAKGNNKIQGLKIWVSGRIKAAEIARTEKAQYGRVPLHTLRADIDYAFVKAQVPNAGLHGIKVWVFKGEKNIVDEI